MARRILPLVLAIATAVAPSTAGATQGKRDPSFGGDGITTAGFGRPSFAAAVVVQPDGRIVAGGAQSGPFSDVHRVALARFLENGALDPSFAGDGKLRLDLAGMERIVDVALQDDGRILALACGPCRLDGRPNLTLLRLLPDGSFDPSFAGDGIRTAALGSGVVPVAMDLQNDGRIVTLGTVVTRSGSPFGFVTAQFESDGSLDRSFGGDGTRRAGAGGAFLRATDVVVAPDGKILVGGIVSEVGSYLTRYRRNGRVDRGFADDGVFRSTYGDMATRAIAIDGEENIVLAGYGGDPASFTGFAVARLTPDGDVDTPFGGDGETFPFFPGDHDQARAVAIRPDGRILAVGHDYPRAVAAQFDVDGSLDEAFADDGQFLRVLGSRGSALGLALQVDGRAVVAGTKLSSVSQNDDRFAVARLLAA